MDKDKNGDNAIVLWYKYRNGSLPENMERYKTKADIEKWERWFCCYDLWLNIIFSNYTLEEDVISL